MFKALGNQIVMLRPLGLTCGGNVTERPLTPAPVSFVKGVTEGDNLEAWTGAGGSKGKMLKISNISKSLKN